VVKKMIVRLSTLFEKPVILDVGIPIGRLVDVKFDERTGNVYALLVKPQELSKDVLKKFRREGEYLIIPVPTLKSVGEFIVIDHSKLVRYAQVK
jgi:sporulation protein YlmC with PRC-barrel domain